MILRKPPAIGLGSTPMPTGTPPVHKIALLQLQPVEPRFTRVQPTMTPIQIPGDAFIGDEEEEEVKPARAPFVRPRLQIPPQITSNLIRSKIQAGIPNAARRAGFSVDTAKGTHSCPRRLPGHATKTISLTALDITETIMRWENNGEPTVDMVSSVGVWEKIRKKINESPRFTARFPFSCFGVYNAIRSQLITINEYLQTVDVEGGGSRTQEALVALHAEAKRYAVALESFIDDYVRIWLAPGYYRYVICARGLAMNEGALSFLADELAKKYETLIKWQAQGFGPDGQVTRFLEATRNTVEKLVELEFTISVAAANVGRRIAAEEGQAAAEAAADQAAAEAAADEALADLNDQRAKAERNLTPWIVGAAIAAGSLFLFA